LTDGASAQAIQEWRPTSTIWRCCSRPPISKRVQSSEDLRGAAAHLSRSSAPRSGTSNGAIATGSERLPHSFHLPPQQSGCTSQALQAAELIVKRKSEGVKIALSERSSIFADDGRTVIAFCESKSISFSRFASECLRTRSSRYSAFTSELLGAKAPDNSNSAVGIRVALLVTRRKNG
jgi:hypothetical protein